MRIDRVAYYFLILSISTLAAHAGPDDQEWKAYFQDFTLRAGPYVHTLNGKHSLTVEYLPHASEISFPQGASQGRDSQNNWILRVGGWFAKDDFMSRDAMDFVLCHELSHLFNPGKNEIFHDYFAITECLPELWRGEDIQAKLKESTKRTMQNRRKFWNRNSPRSAAIVQCYETNIHQAIEGFPFTDCL